MPEQKTWRSVTKWGGGAGHLCELIVLQVVQAAVSVAAEPTQLATVNTGNSGPPGWRSPQASPRALPLIHWLSTVIWLMQTFTTTAQNPKLTRTPSPINTPVPERPKHIQCAAHLLWMLFYLIPPVDILMVYAHNHTVQLSDSMLAWLYLLSSVYIQLAESTLY